MKEDRFGKVIELVWDYAPEAVYLYGHLPFEEAKKAFDEFNDAFHLVASMKHVYARWSCEANVLDATRILREYDSPGKGRFPVTVCRKWRDWSEEELAETRTALKLLERQS